MTKVTINKVKKQALDNGDIWNIYNIKTIFIRVCQEFLHMKQWANSKMFEQGFTEWKITWAANEFSSSFAFSLGPRNWVLANRMQAEVMNDTFSCWGWGREIEMEKEDEEEEKQTEKKKEKQQHLSPPAWPSSSLPPYSDKSKSKMLLMAGLQDEGCPLAAILFIMPEKESSWLITAA